MSVIVPTSDAKNTAKAVAVTTLTTTLANTTSTAHQAAVAAALIQAQHELVVSLMASGKVAPATFLANSTYGT